MYIWKNVDVLTVKPYVLFRSISGLVKDSQIYRSGELKSLHPKIRLILKFANLGWVHHVWAIAQELDLPGIIDRHLGEQKAPHLSMGEYLTLAAINRVDDPGSKTALSSWFEKSWLSSQFDLNPDILNAQTVS